MEFLDIHGERGGESVCANRCIYMHAITDIVQNSLYKVLLSNRGISTSFEGKHGNIRYWLKAEMDKPWSFNHKTKKAFTVISPIDINRPEYQVQRKDFIELAVDCKDNVSFCVEAFVAAYAPQGATRTKLVWKPHHLIVS